MREKKDKILCGEMLRQLRGTCSQQEIANKIGVSSASWSAYENEAKEPPLSTVKKICKIFNVTSDSLLGLPATKTSDQPAITLTSKDVSNLIHAHRLAMERIAELCHASKAGTPVDAVAGGGRATKIA